MDFKAIDQFLNQPHVILGYMSVFLFASAFAVSRASRKEGYKQGQIDAINGRIKYKLVEQINGEIIYEEITPPYNTPTQ